jgi:dihydrolipoamide dehydrogenase
MSEQFDVVIIGGGPAGYVAAIRSAQLGFKTACVEQRGALGGTCLNEGCIPSKALLHDSEVFEHISHEGREHGIIASGLKADYKAMQTRKKGVVENLTKGIEGLFKKNKVTYVIGHGIVMGKGEVAVKKEGGTPESIKAKHIIIATGSEVAKLPGVEVDGKRILTSREALELTEVPGSLVVIGAGVIGLELGSVFRRLGAQVTVVEFMDHITPGQDAEVSRQFQKILEKQGMQFKLASKVTGAKSSPKNVELTVEAKESGKTETLKADYVLVAVGRKAHTDKLGLTESGVAVDERGRIIVDDHFRTNVEGIYAIGDVIAGPMLAHKAEEDGVACVESIAGQKAHVDYNLVPGVIYTHPEVASVGKTEEKLKAEGVQYKVGKFPFLANSRARAMGQTDGFVKIIADANSDEVLGVHIIGPQAGTMIMEAALAMEFKASAEDIARTCHSHPDLHEAIKEAALAVAGRAIHI